MAVGGLPPPASSRGAAPAPRRLASSLLPPLPSVSLLLFGPRGRHATPGAAGAASNKLQQDEFMIFWMGRPRRKEGWTSGRLVPGGGLRPLQRELRLPSPFPNWSPSGVKQSHTGQVLRNTTHYSVSHGSSLLSQMQSQHRESAGRRIRGMESYNWQRATCKISLARAGLSSFSPAEGLQSSTPTSHLALVFV